MPSDEMEMKSPLEVADELWSCSNRYDVSSAKNLMASLKKEVEHCTRMVELISCNVKSPDVSCYEIGTAMSGKADDFITLHVPDQSGAKCKVQVAVGYSPEDNVEIWHQMKLKAEDTLILYQDWDILRGTNGFLDFKVFCREERVAFLTNSLQETRQLVSQLKANQQIGLVVLSVNERVTDNEFFSIQRASNSSEDAHAIKRLQDQLSAKNEDLLLGKIQIGAYIEYIFGHQEIVANTHRGGGLGVDILHGYMPNLSSSNNLNVAATLTSLMSQLRIDNKLKEERIKSLETEAIEREAELEENLIPLKHFRRIHMIDEDRVEDHLAFDPIRMEGLAKVLQRKSNEMEELEGVRKKLRQIIKYKKELSSPLGSPIPFQRHEKMATYYWNLPISDLLKPLENMFGMPLIFRFSWQ